MKAAEIILEKPYHLSYPFVFEHEDRVFTIPENFGRELFSRTLRFAVISGSGSCSKVLLSNISIYDVTLVRHNSKMVVIWS